MHLVDQPDDRELIEQVGGFQRDAIEQVLDRAEVGGLNSSRTSKISGAILA